MKQHSRDIKATFLAPILCNPDNRQPLHLYLSVSDLAVANTLVQEDTKQQCPVYFVSKTLQGPELRYRKLEKSTFALVVTARCL